jgi:hypothetical protein
MMMHVQIAKSHFQSQQAVPLIHGFHAIGTFKIKIQKNNESSAKTRTEGLRVVLSRSCTSVSFACVQKIGIPSIS